MNGTQAAALHAPRAKAAFESSSILKGCVLYTPLEYQVLMRYRQILVKDIDRVS